MGCGWVDAEKEWRRACVGEVCAGSVSAAGGIEFSAVTAAGSSACRFEGGWGCSTAPVVSPDDAPFGLGVLFRLLLVVLAPPRPPRALPFGQPCCFFALGSSTGAWPCAACCATALGASSGDVWICAAETVRAVSAGRAKGCFVSTGGCVCWWYRSAGGGGGAVYGLGGSTGCCACPTGCSAGAGCEMLHRLAVDGGDCAVCVETLKKSSKSWASDSRSLGSPVG